MTTAGTNALTTEPVGLIGLGLLGSAIATRLLSARFLVLGFDVSKSAREQHQERGGMVTDHSAAVADGCSRILLSLPDHRVVEEVLRDLPLRQGQIIIDTSTGDPRAAERIGDWLDSISVAYLDATISGSSEQTRQGAATLMVGGEQAAFDQCVDLFQSIAQRAFHTGSRGTGAEMKLVTNLVLGLNRAALAEGLAFAQSLNLDLPTVLEILQSSPAQSRIMDAKGPKMISGEYSPQARLSQHLKDVRLMIDLARESGASLPLTSEHQSLLEQAEAVGLGELDNSALFEVYKTRHARPGT